MVTADVDGDGDADVVTKASGLAWHENLGPDGFVTHAIPSSSIGSEDFAAGDLDSDGDVDLFGFSGAALVWMENDGNQNFTRRTWSIGAPQTTPTSINALDIADLDADGDMDVLFTDLTSASVFVLVNNGRQQFTLRQIGELGIYATSVVAADMDHDGDLDVVAGGDGFPNQFGDVVWLQNNGALTFTSRIVKPASSPNNPVTESVAVGDVDGDGDLDVVAAGTAGTSGTAVSLTWHEQAAGNQFVAHDIDAGRSLRWAALADFDVDGDLDILVSGFTTSIDLYENFGDGQFIRRQLSAAVSSGYSVAAADMDGDGDLDAVAQSVAGAARVAWFENVNFIDPDFGDAPAPYPTLRTDGGPFHNGGGPRLGAARDAESDGAPTPLADGDLDDGVTLPAVRVGQSTATVTVNAQNAAAGARLDAWIDFNRDGSFGGAGEQIFASLPVAEGDNALGIDIPATMVAGAATARFRISTAGGLRPTGGTLDGEVEDYLLEIAPAGSSTGEFGSPLIDGGFVNSLRVADIDGDGDADYLTVAQTTSPRLAWRENLGDGAFLLHRFAFSGPTPQDARPVDFDRDGDIDIVVTDQSAGGLAWYENNGAQSFTYHSATGATSGLGAAFDVADVDGDGDLDAIASRSVSSTQQIVVLLNDGQQGFASNLPLTTPALTPNAIRAADVDGDGDMDFAVSFDGDSRGWFEHSGAGWTYHNLAAVPGSEQMRTARDIVPVDFDGDGDMDLVSLAGVSAQLALDLYRNDGAENFTRETLASTSGATFFTATTTGGDRLQVADLDGDGDFDAVAGASFGTRVYRNDGPAGFTQFLAPGTGATSNSSTPVAVGDFDGDGRLEILASGGPSAGTYRLDDLPLGDYDRSGVVDQADRDLYDVTLGQAAVPPGSGADGDRSGTVDAPDLAIWEANQGRRTAPLIRAADFDQNEFIDGDDFLRWQLRAGETSQFPGMFIEDADLNAAVDGGDLAVWNRQFGQGVAPAVGPIESPTATQNAEPLMAASATVDLAAAAAVEPAAAPAAALRARHAPDSRWAYVAAHDAALASFTTPATNSADRTRWRLRLSSSDSKSSRLIATLVDELLADPWESD